MNGIELFENIKSSNTFKELILSFTKQQSKKGNIYEKVWDLIIKCGFCSLLPNNIYDHYEGNINTCNIKKVDNIELFLQNLLVFSKGRGGSSDITLQNKITNKWIFISSKFYIDDTKKSIDDYDVEKILAVIKEHSHKYKEYDIFLLVNNKQKVLNTLNSSQSTNNYIKNNIAYILDITDLEIYFQAFKQIIKNISFNEINANFCNPKIPLILRFHQDLITYKQMEKINEGEKELLLGAKARSGKTYCVGGLLLKYYKKYKKLNALIITPAPTETLTQFTDDLFHKFQDFIGINIVEIKKGIDFENMQLQDKNIIIISKQLLDDYVFEKKQASISNLNLDIIVIDEAHFHATTQMFKNILQSYSTHNTIKLFLTATYAKPLNEYNIPQDCQHYWDIEDEQLCKHRNIAALINKHGDAAVELFLNETNIERVLSVYDKMPDLHIITNMMDRKRYDIIKENIKDTSYGFSNGTLLSTTHDGMNFNYIEEVDTMLKYISGQGTIYTEEMEFIRDVKSIFERIKKISVEMHSRTNLNNGDFTSQLWFLPFGQNMLIDNVSCCLKQRMMKNRILQNYEILIVNSKKEYKLKDIKEEIRNKECKAKAEGKTGLIILVGNQLTLGITLPFVDVVFLFNDLISSDKILQMMYRCMTETLNSEENDKINNGIKRIGIVVDLNISRVLNTIIDYNVYQKNLNIEQKITYLVENNLINIDVDLFKTRENKTLLIEKLMHIWKSDPINNLKTLLRKIEENIISMDTKDQRLINQYFTSSIGDGKINIKVNFDDENEEPLQTGKEIIKQNVEDNTDNTESSVNIDNIEDTEEEKKKEKEINISLTKDILPFIIPLSCILTMNTEQKDILEMIHIIKNNPELLNVFQDQTFIWWNKKDIITMIEKIVDKYIKRDTIIYNIAIQFKMSLQSLIDNPKELLELIDSCLKPKLIEKKQFGEVFTPMKLVNEMLDKLPVEIWSNKSLTWLDPCCGMGNFPIAVYLRLIEGLKDEITDITERKKHILEKMLYMCELNKKNVFICQQIFDINDEYQLNIYEGDSLVLDYNKQFGINKFDIIIGNPPYQEVDEKGISKGGTNLFTKFINISFELLKENGYLNFITPISWLGPSINIQSGNDLLHNIFLKYDILYLNLNECKKYFNVGSTFSYYIICKSINDNLITKIISEYNKKIELSEINLKKYNNLRFLPIHITLDTINLVNNVINKKNKLIIERCRKLDTSTKNGKLHLKLKKDDIFKYTTFHTTSKTYYSDIKLELYNDTKILLNMAGYLKPEICSNCNITESKYFIIGNEEISQQIINLLNSKIIIKYLELCKYSGFNSRPVLECISYNNLNDVENNILTDNILLNKIIEENNIENNVENNIENNVENNIECNMVIEKVKSIIKKVIKPRIRLIRKKTI